MTQVDQTIEKVYKALDDHRDYLVELTQKMVGFKKG